MSFAEVTASRVSSFTPVSLHVYVSVTRIPAQSGHVDPAFELRFHLERIPRLHFQGYDAGNIFVTLAQLQRAMTGRHPHLENSIRVEVVVQRPEADRAFHAVAAAAKAEKEHTDRHPALGRPG